MNNKKKPSSRDTENDRIRWDDPVLSYLVLGIIKPQSQEARRVYLCFAQITGILAGLAVLVWLVEYAFGVAFPAPPSP